MLATMNGSQHDVSGREHPHLNLTHSNFDAHPDPAYGMGDRLCPGCKKSAVSEQGGLVVAFGQSFFHVDCFKCAKCANQVTADTNLLLLSDGSPICANCSYSCNVCHLPILDEAIMTGDDSYHAHCFKCKVCKNRIDELVFAKTSQGIYCMNCHSERMIKIRKHAQKKAERDKLQGGSSSSKLRERERTLHNETGGAAGMSDASAQPSTSQPALHEGSPSQNYPKSGDYAMPRSPMKRASGPLVSDAFEPNASSAAIGSQSAQGSPKINTMAVSPTSPSFASFAPSVTIAPPVDSDHITLKASSTTQYNTLPRASRHSPPDINRQIPDKQNTLPLPENSERSPEEERNRRKSCDDGIQPLNALLPQKPVAATFTNGLNGCNSPNGLNVSKLTSRNERRRSIMPGLSLSNYDSNSAPSSSGYPTGPHPTLSPSTATFQSRSATPPVYGRDSPSTLSPLREAFPESSRRTSLADSMHSKTSSRNNSRTPSPAPAETDLNNWVDGQPRSRSASTAQEQATTARPLLRPTLTADKIPPRKSSLLDPLSAPQFSDGMGMFQGGMSFGFGPSNVNGHAVRVQKSFDDRSWQQTPDSLRSAPALGLQVRRSRSNSRSSTKSPTPRQADVPDDVDQGRDAEADADSDQSNELPPAPPPKERGATTCTPEPAPIAQSEEKNELKVAIPETIPDASPSSQHSAEGSDDMMESSPVKRVTSTFIAPALPPIRFSMSGADFADLLSTVGGVPSVKALDQLASLSEDGAQDLLLTPSPTESSNRSPSSDGTVAGPSSPNGEVSPGDETASTNPLPHDRTPRISAEEHAKLNGLISSISRTGPNQSTSDISASRSSLTLAESGPPPARVTLTEPGSHTAKAIRTDTDLVLWRLQEALGNANERGALQLKLDKSFVEAIIDAMEQRRTEYHELKTKIDSVKRASKHYIDGLTVAQTEYEQELKARRDAEAEVTRLRILLSGQVARLSAMSTDTKRYEMREQMSRELNENLTGLERDLSKLRVERDMTLAEVEELSASKHSPVTTQNPELPATSVSRSLTKRLDHIKTQYKHELIPLNEQRECLTREIAELKTARDAFLEETTVLNVRNEELAQLSAQYARRMEAMEGNMEKGSHSMDKVRAQQQSPMPNSHSSSTTVSSNDDNSESKFVKVHKADLPDFHTPSSKGKFMKWGSKQKEATPPAVVVESGKAKAHLEHTFQQLSVLRFTRCDQCGDKMWGSQLRCSGCNISVHVRCITHVNNWCTQLSAVTTREDGSLIPLPPSMFGRNLIEQVRTDARGSERCVPIIVEKCIDAVEALALDFEGVYRKNGGSGQIKTITKLFEKGDYNAFDLRDTNRFNDICSVTSVLKTYFRTLPDPLLTYDLHEHFVAAVQTKDTVAKNQVMTDLVNRLPKEHYYTVRMLMMHLHHVKEHCEKNLMNARNLGVVFGPTLLRSSDPGAEFSDMAGKALTVEWLVENASRIFK